MYKQNVIEHFDYVLDNKHINLVDLLKQQYPIRLEITIIFRCLEEKYFIQSNHLVANVDSNLVLLDIHNHIVFQQDFV